MWDGDSSIICKWLQLLQKAVSNCPSSDHRKYKCTKYDGEGNPKEDWGTPSSFWDCWHSKVWSKWGAEDQQNVIWSQTLLIPNKAKGQEVFWANHVRLSICNGKPKNKGGQSSHTENEKCSHHDSFRVLLSHWPPLEKRKPNLEH